MNRSFNNIENLTNILIFVIFLLPLKYISGISSNYLFILYPLILVLFKNKIVIPHKYVLIAITFYFILFLIGILTQSDLSQFFIRRILSFLIFMSIFSFLFISIDQDKISAFKISIVLYSLYFIIPSIGVYFFAGASGIEDNIKEQFGSQRYGFIYLMAFWIVYLDTPKEMPWSSILKYIVLTLLLIGILMTFSRSSVASLLMSLIIYVLYGIYNNKKSFSETIKRLFVFVFSCICLFFVVYLLSPRFIEFFNATFFSILLDKGIEGFDVLNNNSSIGYRLYMFDKIMNFISENLLTGSGYLGVWVLFDNLSGSAHNQYTDVLFRVGIFGFIIYILFIKRMTYYLFKYDKSLFFGFTGVLFYGLFHETFKLSHGGFLFAFLLALAFQKNKKNVKAT
jgi:O-antigen ligase